MADGHIHKHLQSMFHLLGNDETLKMVSHLVVSFPTQIAKRDSNLAFFFTRTNELLFGFLANHFLIILIFKTGG